MSLSDLPSYSSHSHSPPDDDDKWVYDDPLSVVNPPKSTDVPDTKHNSGSDGLETVPKLLSESKVNSSSSHKSTKSSKKIPDQTADESESEQGSLDESISQSASIRSHESSQKSEKSSKKSPHGYAPQIQIALTGNKLAFADGTWQDVSDIGELIDKVHPIVAEKINLQRRAELLVKLIAKSEYESQLIQNEINECDEVINGLKKILGDDDGSESHTTIVEEEEEPEDF